MPCADPGPFGSLVRRRFRARGAVRSCAETETAPAANHCGRGGFSYESHREAGCVFGAAILRRSDEGKGRVAETGLARGSDRKGGGAGRSACRTEPHFGAARRSRHGAVRFRKAAHYFRDAAVRTVRASAVSEGRAQIPAVFGTRALVSDMRSGSVPGRAGRMCTEGQTAAGAVLTTATSWVTGAILPSMRMVPQYFSCARFTARPTRAWSRSDETSRL